MFWNVLAIVYGSAVALFPERTIDYLSRMLLVGYENPEDLEASDWFVSLTRMKGILLVVAGILAIVIEGLSAKISREESSDDDEKSSPSEEE